MASNWFNNSNTNASSSGTTGFGGGFGGQTQQQTGFGGQTQQTGFGGQTQQPGFGTSFGAPQLSGNTGTAGANRPGLFGASSGFGASTTTSGFGSGFGGQPAQPAQTVGFGGGGFGTAGGMTMGMGGMSAATPSMNVGSGNPPFQVTAELDSNGSATSNFFQTLTAMPAYQGKSFEEIRLEDYQSGKKFAQGKAFGASTGFGGTALGTTTTGFGASSGGFGLNTSATSGSTFGASTFGAQQQQQQPAFGGQTTGSGFGGFGSQTTAPKPMGFGATPMTGGMFGGSNVFGQQPSTTATTGSMFGAGGSTFGASTNPMVTNTATSSIFGAAKPTAGAFGSGTTNTGGFGTFGTSAPASTGFGVAAQAPSFGSFGTVAATTTAQGTTSAFGGGFQTGGFGAAPTTTTAVTGFGAAMTPGATPFGAGAAGGLFGSTAQQPNAFQPGQPQQQPSSFATPSATPGTGLFGSTQSTGFGTTVATAGTTAPATTSIFGNTAAKPISFGGFGATGASAATGAFGGFSGLGTSTSATTATLPATTAAAPFSLFGGSGIGAPATAATIGATTSVAGTSLFPSLGTSNTTGGSLFGGQGASSMFGAKAPVAATSSALFPTSTSMTPQKQPTGNLIPTIDNKPFGASPLFTTIPGSAPVSSNLGKSMTEQQQTLDVTQQQKQLTFSARRFTPKSVTKFKPRGPMVTTSTPSAKEALFRPMESSVVTSRTPLKASSGTPVSGSRFDYSSTPAGKSISDSVSKTARSLITRSSVKELVILDGGKGPFASAAKDSKVLLGARKPLTDGNSKSDVTTSFMGKTSSLASLNEAGGGGAFSTPLASKSTNVLREIQQQPVISSYPSATSTQISESEYSSSPTLAELLRMDIKNLRRIPNMKITRQGYGTITFLHPVDLSAFHDDLASVVQGVIVKFAEREVTVYPDESIKPPVGQGLNVPARITLEKCMPKGSVDPEADKIQRHIDRLKRIPDTHFISFDVNTGKWTFEVEHFTRYGLDEDEDDENIDEESKPLADVITKVLTEKIVGKDSSYEYYEVEMEDDEDDGEEEISSSAKMNGSEDEEFILEGDEDAEIIQVVDINNPQKSAELPATLNDEYNKPEGQTPFFQRYHSQDSDLLPRQLGLSAARIQTLQSGLFGSKMPVSKDTSSITSAPISPSKRVFPFFGLSEVKKGRLESTLPEREDPTCFSGISAKPIEVKTIPYSDSIRHDREGVYKHMGFSFGASFSGCFVPGKNMFVKPTRMKDGSFGITFYSLMNDARQTQESSKSLFPGKNVANQGISENGLGFYEKVRLEFALDHSNIIDSLNEYPKASLNKDGLTFRALVEYQKKAVVEGSGVKDEAFYTLWNLCSVLFDPIKSEEGEPFGGYRKSQLQKYLVSQDLVPVGDGSSPWKILHFLFLNNLDEAREEALKSGYPRLALLLCQVPGSQDFKTLIAEQVETWKRESTRINPQILCIYELMAGSVDSTLEMLLSDGGLRKNNYVLKWKLALNLFLCFAINEGDDWTKGFKMFELWNQKNGAFSALINGDILYLLIKLAADPLSVRLESLLTPEKFNSLSFEIPFLLYNMLRARNISDTRDPSKTHHLLVQGYVDDLLGKGAGTWAVFVLLYRQSGHEERNRALFKIINQTFPLQIRSGVRTLEAIEKDESFLFLTQKLHISRQVLFHALAYYCWNGAGNMQDCLELLIQAKQWNEAHQCLFASPWIYESVLGEDYTRVLDILRTFKSVSHEISEWNNRGQIFLQFLEVITVGESRLISKVTFNAISRSLEDIAITCRLEEVDCSDLKGLCCMEMATRLFRLMPRGELMMHGGDDVRDSLIVSDEKLAWVKDLSFSLFSL